MNVVTCWNLKFRKSINHFTSTNLWINQWKWTKSTNQTTLSSVTHAKKKMRCIISKMQLNFGSCKPRKKSAVSSTLYSLYTLILSISIVRSIWSFEITQSFSLEYLLTNQRQNLEFIVHTAMTTLLFLFLKNYVRIFCSRP